MVTQSRAFNLCHLVETGIYVTGESESHEWMVDKGSLEK